jgi:hypothetical protein
LYVRCLFCRSVCLCVCVCVRLLSGSLIKSTRNRCLTGSWMGPARSSALQ